MGTAARADVRFVSMNEVEPGRPAGVQLRLTR